MLDIVLLSIALLRSFGGLPCLTPLDTQGYRTDWTELCCWNFCDEWEVEQGDTDCEGEGQPPLVPRTDVYFDIYAPVDGVVYLLPDPGEVQPCRCESEGDTDTLEDACDLCGDSDGDLPGSGDTDVEETDADLDVFCIPENIPRENYGAGGLPLSGPPGEPDTDTDVEPEDTDDDIPCSFVDGVPRSATRLPYPSMNLAVVNHQKNVVFRLMHVESCLENGTEVIAGQRIARGSAWMELDLEVWFNSDRDRWRAVSYFEMLPDALYRIYEAKFGFAPRGTGLPSDPIIPLQQRDACPGLPVDDSVGETDDPTNLKHPDPATPRLGCEAFDFQVDLDTDTDVVRPGDIPTCPRESCTFSAPATCFGVACELANDMDAVPACPCTPFPAEVTPSIRLCDGWTSCDTTGTNPMVEDCTCTDEARGPLPRCVECAGASCEQLACPAELIRRLDIGGPQ